MKAILAALYLPYGLIAGFVPTAIINTGNIQTNSSGLRAEMQGFVQISRKPGYFGKRLKPN